MKQSTALHNNRPEPPYNAKPAPSPRRTDPPSLDDRGSKGVVGFDEARQSLLRRRELLAQHHPEAFESHCLRAITAGDVEYELRRLRGDPHRLVAEQAAGSSDPNAANLGSASFPAEEVLHVDADAFVEGRSFANRVSGRAGTRARSELHRAYVEDVLAALLDEFKPATASKRMLVELAAHAFGDWASFSSTMRASSETSATNAMRNAKIADLAATRAMRCLELLRRPAEAHVNITIDPPSSPSRLSRKPTRQTSRSPTVTRQGK